MHVTPSFRSKLDIERINVLLLIPIFSIITDFLSLQAYIDDRFLTPLTVMLFDSQILLISLLSFFESQPYV